MKTTRTPAFVNTSAGRQNLLAAALVGALAGGEHALLEIAPGTPDPYTPPK